MNLERMLLRFFVWPVHRALLRVTSGRTGIEEPSTARMGVLLLMTIGRRSGEARRLPVYFLRDEDRLVLVASNAGDDRHPAWYLNLKADPAVTVSTPRGTREYVARDASDAERERLWPELVTRNPGFARYERRTQRHIPIVILEASQTGSLSRRTSTTMV